jgi:hypothetical protein
VETLDSGKGRRFFIAGILAGLWSVHIFSWYAGCLPAEHLSRIARIVFTVMGFLFFMRTFLQAPSYALCESTILLNALI